MHFSHFIDKRSTVGTGTAFKGRANARDTKILKAMLLKNTNSFLVLNCFYRNYIS